MEQEGPGGSASCQPRGAVSLLTLARLETPEPSYLRQSLPFLPLPHVASGLPASSVLTRSWWVVEGWGLQRPRGQPRRVSHGARGLSLHRASRTGGGPPSGSGCALGPGPRRAPRKCRNVCWGLRVFDHVHVRVTLIPPREQCKCTARCHVARSRCCPPSRRRSSGMCYPH